MDDLYNALVSNNQLSGVSLYEETVGDNGSSTSNGELGEDDASTQPPIVEVYSTTDC